MKKILLKRYKMIFVIFIVFTAFALYFVMPLALIQIKIPFIFSPNPNEKSEIEHFFNSKNKKTEFFKIPTVKQDSIEGFIVKAHKSHATIIFLHGIRSSKAQFVKHIDTLSHWGYDCVAIDLRGHGNSNSSYTTFGHYETEDTKKLLDYLEKSNAINPKIGILGYSLGGAVALKTLSQDNRLQFGIIQSTYAQFPVLINDYQKRLSGIGSKTITEFLINRASTIGEFKPESLNPKEYCENITQPILYFHGTADDRISINYGKENFDQIKSTNKQFITIENATHTNLEKVAQQQYWNNLKQFLAQQTTKPPL